jgi:hypothetical protein
MTVAARTCRCFAQLSLLIRAVRDHDSTQKPSALKSGPSHFGISKLTVIGISLALLTSVWSSSLSFAADVTSCDGYLAIKSAAADRFVSIQAEQVGHNFWSSSKSLSGATRCRVYHSDKGNYHTLECEWKDIDDAAAERQVKVLTTDVARCLNPRDSEQRPVEAPYFARSVFSFDRFPEYRVKAEVTDQESDQKRSVSFEVSRTDSEGAEGAGAGASPAGQGNLNLQGLSLHIAAQKGDLAGIQAALSAKINVDDASFSGTTPLWDAGFNDQIPAIDFLLKAGANMNGGAPGGQGIPLQGALLGNHLDAANAMLAASRSRIDVHGPAVSTMTGSLLSQMVRAGDPALLSIFIDHATNIDPNELDIPQQWSALDTAIIANQLDQVNVLVRKLHGWKFAEQEPMKETTLFAAVRSGSAGAVKAILDNIPGLDLSHKNAIGQTVLDIAADNPQMLKELLTYRAPANK